MTSVLAVLHAAGAFQDPTDEDEIVYMRSCINIYIYRCVLLAVVCSFLRQRGEILSARFVLRSTAYKRVDKPPAISKST